ncbi:MAG: BamA/TamA family outer membrane protein [Ekhidna sp.]|nr:BamA/TamA family outer membrane protein [Ekhidna sp.]
MFVLLLVSSGQCKLYGQTGVDKFIDWFTIHPNKRVAALDSTIYPAKIILAPLISYSPETSIALGVGAKWLFKMRGSGDETRTSNMPISLKYTFKNQFLLSSGFEVFSPGEKWMLTGNVDVKRFPRFYYGVGRNTLERDEEEYTFNQLLIEPILLKRLFHRYLFLGGGIRYNRISGVFFSDPEGTLALSDQLGIDGSTSVALEAAIVFDSRNNILSANSGWYLEATHGVYNTALSSDYDFELTRIDLRGFVSPFKRRKDVIGFQVRAHLSHGDLPLNEMAFLGSDEIMRGYYEGRFIDRNMFMAQVEYRRDIKGRLGAVAFVGAGDVAERVADFSFSDMKPSLGFGLRFLLDKREDLNVRFDWGFGEGTDNYYLNVAEAF